MKVRKTEVMDVDVTHVMINLPMRHVGTSDDDDLHPNSPMLTEGGNCWRAMVLVDTGEITGWPQAYELNLFTKVCDEGTYILLNGNGKGISELREWYVPHGLIPGEYGDYVHLDIGPDGVIRNWPRAPDLSEFPGIEEAA